MAEWLREMSVGEWFDADGDEFEIVGIDTAQEVVLVQHFDGTVEEFDFDSWLELRAVPCAAPEDYSAAMGLIREDYDGLLSDTTADLGLENPLRRLED